MENAKAELRKVLDDGKVGTVKELKTELEATLYRITVGHSEGAEANVRETDTNFLTINFDKALGKEPQVRKRLLRYQMNPRPDWGLRYSNGNTVCRFGCEATLVKSSNVMSSNHRSIKPSIQQSSLVLVLSHICINTSHTFFDQHRYYLQTLI